MMIILNGDKMKNTSIFKGIIDLDEFRLIKQSKNIYKVFVLCDNAYIYNGTYELESKSNLGKYVELKAIIK